MKHEEKKLRLNKKIFLLGSVLSSFTPHDAVVAIYWVQITGSYSLAMLYFMVLNLSTSILEVPTGLLSDRIGRRHALLLSKISWLVSFIFVLTARDVYFLLLSGVFAGLGRSLSSGTLEAFEYETLEELGEKEEYEKFTGKRRALGKYSQVVSGLTGMAIIKFFSLWHAVLVTTVFSIIPILVYLFLTETNHFDKVSENMLQSLKKSWKLFKKDFRMRNVSLGRVISTGADNVEYSFRSLYFQVLIPTWAVSGMKAVGSLAAAVSMYYSHFITKKIGYMKALVPSILGMRILNSIFILLNNIWSPFLMTVFTNMSFGVREVATDKLLQDRFDPKNRATMGSMVSLLGTLFYSVLAVGVGYMADTVGLKYTILILQAIIASSAIFYYLGLRKRKEIFQS